MSLGLLFWGIAIICVIFGFVGARNTAYAPYVPVPVFILVLILGWQVFGPALHR